MADYNDKINKNKNKFKLLDYKFKIDEFAARGLNKYRNFLSAPDCDCGCGGKGWPVFDTNEDLYDFCSEVLEDHGCHNSAIFLIHMNGEMEIVHGHIEWDEDTEEESYTVSLLSSEVDMPADTFARIDADLRLCCYGLIIERDNNMWEICE